MATIGDKLNEALEKKYDDVNTFIWKFPKDRDNKNIQDKVKLINCTQDQLQEFYDHCEDMLRNEDKLNPGRYNVLNIIKFQKDKIGAELLLREMQRDDKTFTRFALSEAINEFIDRAKEGGDIINPNHSTFGQYYATPLSTKYNKLTLQTILDACNNRLGIFDTTHITKSFLLKRGIWIDREGVKKLKDYALKAGINNASMMGIARQYLRLKEHHILKKNSKGLTVDEMKSMLALKSCRINDLTTEQLEILRYKVLLDLERNVKDHIGRWETLISQIKKVAKVNKFTIRVKVNE